MTRGEMSNRDPDPRRARLDRLYRAQRIHILAYCARRASAEDARDACAETFLVAWRKLESVPFGDRALPYLYRVAARVLANQRRSARRRHSLVGKLAGFGTETTVDTVSLVVRREEARIVEAAVRRLPPRDREIVMLHDWEELTRQQIADVVGMSKASVDKRLSRAYRRLGRQLQCSLAPTATNTAAPLAESGGTT
jgi:RNA polymerase sigma-70 factor (ECF subfamily)